MPSGVQPSTDDQGKWSAWHYAVGILLHRPATVALVCAALAALGVWRAARLTVVTDFADLLAPQQPSVVEMRRIVARTRGLSNVFVVLEGRDAAALRSLADGLVPGIAALGNPFVESAASGVQAARHFLMPRAGLFVPKERLDELLDQLKDRERAAFRRSIGADLDSGDDGPPLDEGEIRQQLISRLGPLARYPAGYFQGDSPFGAAVIVVVKSAIVAGDLTGSRATLEKIRDVVNRTMTARGDQAPGGGIRVGYAGDLVTGLAEYELVRQDVLGVGVLGISLVLGLLLFFFQSWRAMVALGAAIAAGCAVTFGLAELLLGHLNVASAFQFSIVAGNGINFGIIWLARYGDERRRGRPVPDALDLALRGTIGATLAAACAAAVAYAALGVSQFGGFRHFSLIGAIGMLACWLASTTLLPAVVVMLDRERRNGSGEPKLSGFATPGVRLQAPFVWVVARAPGTTVVVALGLTVVALFIGGRHLARGPLEYDMRRIQSDPRSTAELYRVSAVAARIVGANTEGAMVVLTDDERDTPALAAALRRVRDRVPHAERPFEEVHTLDDFVPPQQQERLGSLRALAAQLRRMRDRGAIDDSAWADWEPLLPPHDLRPFGAADLPADILALFTERDGHRGRIVYIEPTAGQNDSDLRYLLRWADAFRQTRLPNGRVVHGSGRAVIFADLLRASLIDMPRVVTLSLALTCLTVLLLFRKVGATGIVLSSLGMALAWLMGAFGALDLRLSFMNFIALPITFGIGVDYAVNMYGRYQQDIPAGIEAAMRGSGGAVVLCSLTTCIGYVVLLRAHNQGIRSLGALAVLGEISCLSTALFVLPAAILWAERRRRRPSVGSPAKQEYLLSQISPREGLR